MKVLLDITLIELTVGHTIAPYRVTCWCTH